MPRFSSHGAETGNGMSETGGYQRRGGWLLGTFHPYARWSVLMMVIGFAFVLLIRIDGVPFLMISSALSAMLVAHTFIKYRWPGPTATERARRPVARDLWLAGGGLALALVGFVLALILGDAWAMSCEWWTVPGSLPL